MNQSDTPLGEQAALLSSSKDRITALQRISQATQISLSRTVVMNALGHLTSRYAVLQNVSIFYISIL